MTKSKTNCFNITAIDLKNILLPDGGSVTRNEPTSVRITSNPAEVLPPGIEQVYERFPVTLNWNYSLTSGLSLGVIKFNSDGIVSISADGSAGPVNAKFQIRLNVSLTTKRASLFNIETYCFLPASQEMYGEQYEGCAY